MAKGLRATRGPASPPYSNGPYQMSEALVLNKPVVEGAERYVLEENFAQLPKLNANIANDPANKNFEILGTHGVEADVTFATLVGGVELETAGADNDQVIILPHLDSGQTAWANIKWGTENQVIWETVVKTDSDITTGVLYWAGLKLTNTPTIATDADQAFFRYSTDDSDTTWRCVASIGGTDVNNDSGVTIEASTIYYFRIEIDKDRKARFFINNKEVYRSTALTNDVDLIPYVGVQALSAAAAFLYLVKQKISRYVYE